MAKFITQKTLLERLLKEGLRVNKMTLWNYNQKGVFKPIQEIKYGGTTLPLYLDEDVQRLKEIIIQRYKLRETKSKSVFVNGVPKSLLSYKKRSGVRKVNNATRSQQEN